MQTENRIFEDLVKFVNGAAGTLAGVGREAEATARTRAKEWLGGLDFVSRDEFEAVKAMAASARDEADALRARLDRMEAAGSPSAAAAGTQPGAAAMHPGTVASEPASATSEPTAALRADEGLAGETADQPGDSA